MMIRAAILTNYIPAELKGLPQWTLWKEVVRDGHETKPPFRLDGTLGDSSDPEAWMSFHDALKAIQDGAHGFEGIGFTFTDDDPYTGIDLDHCRNSNTGEIAPWAQQIIRALDSFTEISPSAEGVHIVVEGRLPGERNRTGSVEMYDKERYFTFTGHIVEGTRPTIERRQKELTAFYNVTFPKVANPTPVRSHPVFLEDDAVIQKAFAAINADRFRRLWDGDPNDYTSESEADLALASHLAFWTGGDAAQIDRLFRQSGLYREKWERSDYRDMTIKKALSSGEFYSVNGNAPQRSKAASEEDWPERGELPQLPAPPSLPAELIPEPLRLWALDIAERASIPLEFVGCPAMVGLSAVVGRSVAIQPSQFDDWVVVPNLWGGIVGRPGVMKTYAVNEALKPLGRLAVEARERFQAEENAKSTLRDTLEAQITAVKGEMVKAAKGKGDLDALQEKLRSLKEDLRDAVVIERRYITQDATVEKLGELLTENPRGLLVSRDELAGWLRTLDKHGREGDREFFLEAWNGTGAYTFDRIGRGTVHIPAVTVSLVGGIQPGKLRGYIDEATSEGRGADGLLQRLQLMVWPNGVGPWEKADRWPNKEAKNRVFEIFKALDRLQLESDDAEIPALRFDPDAQVLFDSWRNELENRLRTNELAETPAFESHLSKYRSLMPSLALLFHLVDVVDPSGTSVTEAPVRPEDNFTVEVPPVSLDAAKLAAAWCDFLESHAEKVYASEVHHGLETGRMLAQRISDGDVKDGDTVRSIYRNHWKGLSLPSNVVAALESLGQVGWVRLEQKATGGRPEDVVRLHPELRRTSDE